MRVGLLAYSTDTGLGHQTLEFYRHMQPAKTLVCDLRRYNGMDTHHERYPDAKIVRGIPDCNAMDWLTDDVDAVFVAETPLNFCLFEKAKAKGVVAIQQYNFEFLDFFRHPDWEAPGILAAPTNWNIDKVRALDKAPVVDWPVPVNRELIPFRKIDRCKMFVHVVGRPAVHDRNGTIAFLEAAKKCGDRFKYRVYVQTPIDARAIEYFEPVRRALEAAQATIDLEVIYDTKNYRDIYSEGDVLVMPRKYGGLCLPMQEALSAGMPVIMTDIEPNNSRLPKEWLVKANHKGTFFAHVDLDYYEADINYLTFAMMQFASGEFMAKANIMANDIAEGLSWEKLKPVYESLIEQVCQK